MMQLISISPQWALLAGMVLSFVLKNQKIQDWAKLWSTRLLQLSVVLLGASLNFSSVIKQGTQGALITALSILFVFALGHLGTKLLKINKEQGLLITMGTAICGGSAIGSLAPIIQADGLAITIAFAVVFFLNALSVFIFPYFGNLLALTQEQFGLWAALAIHDTSSVVAASSIYGSKALELATTIKLTRALWIIPITFLFGLYAKKEGEKRIPIPWFIIGFLLLSMTFTFIEFPVSWKMQLTELAKLGFSMTLFLIGLNFNWKKIKQVGTRPLLFGLSLWLIVCLTSLLLIICFI